MKEVNLFNSNNVSSVISKTENWIDINWTETVKTEPNLFYFSLV